MTTNLIDIQNSDVIMATSNMAENHPVGFQWVMKAKERGAKFIHVDPRFTRTSAAFLGLHHPLEADRVVRGHVGGGHDDIRVLDVDQVRRHRPATERGPES